MGFIIAGIKELEGRQGGRHRHAGKKLPAKPGPPPRPLPGFKEIQPQVFAGLYPTEASQYDQLRDALEKLQAQRRLAALRAGGQPGAGLRLPLRFPGLLHMEIVQERLSASSTRT